MARRWGFIVVKVVIPKQLFSRGDVAQGKDPRALIDLFDLTVGVARMIQISAKPFAIDDGLAVLQTVEIRAGRAIVEPVGLLGSDPRASIFHNASTFADRRGGENTNRMNA